jgi:hypothetical protein
MLEIIAHELGHIHEKEYFNQASPDVKEALKKAHATWVKSQKGRSAQELVDSLRGRATARVMAIDPNAKADNLNPYWTSFGEWYADQTSRWAVTSKSPVSVVEKFFKKLAIQLRSFYQQLRNAKYLPNETFVKYIEEATGKSVDLTPQDDRASQMATQNINEESGEGRPLTEKQFYIQYAQHVDLRGRDGTSSATKEAILRNGFKKGFNVNALPPY